MCDVRVYKYLTRGYYCTRTVDDSHGAARNGAAQARRHPEHLVRRGMRSDAAHDALRGHQDIHRHVLARTPPRVPGHRRPDPRMLVGRLVDFGLCTLFATFSL